MDVLMNSLGLWHSMPGSCYTEMPSPRFSLWFPTAVGYPTCHAIPSSSGLGWHSWRGPLIPMGTPSLLYLGSDSTCFLYPAWAWISCARSLPKQMSFSPKFCSYTLIKATAASPQLTSVDGYLPLPYLMTSELYCSEKERNWEKGKKNKKKMHRKRKWKGRKEKRRDGIGRKGKEEESGYLKMTFQK